MQKFRARIGSFILVFAVAIMATNALPFGFRLTVQAEEAPSPTLGRDISDGTNNGGDTRYAESRPRREKVAMVVKGRLAYRLYDDGTATVVDETGAVGNFVPKPADITVPPAIFYEGKWYKVTTIGQLAFTYSSYKNIVIPDTVHTIGWAAFYQTECLELTLPDTITSIGGYAFCKFTVQGDFRYPSGMTEIPSGALESCISKEGALIIPDTVTALQYRSIYNVQSPVILSCNLTELAPYSLVVDYDKLSIGGEGGNVLEDGMLFNHDKTELLKFIKITSDEIHIPGTVRRIHPYAFAGEDEVDRGEYGYRFSSVGDVCHTVRVFVPEGVREIEEGTFYDSAWLDYLSLPSTLERVGEDALAGEYEREAPVHTVAFHSTEAPEVEGEERTYGNRAVDIYVPDGCEEGYKAAFEGRLGYENIYPERQGKAAATEPVPVTGGGQTARRQQAGGASTMVGGGEPGTAVLDHVRYTLYGDGTAEVAKAGEGLETQPWKHTISEGDFYPWKVFGANIKSLEIPEMISVGGRDYTVTALGAGSFIGPTRYGSITLPDTVTYIGDNAFYQADIETINLGSVTGMGDGVFAEAFIRQGIVFPPSMDTVPYCTFYRTRAPKITIPDSVTKLERYAVMIRNYPSQLEYSPEPTEVTLSKNITEVGECGFLADPRVGCTVRLTGEGGNVIEDGILFNADKTELIAAFGPITGDLRIPGTVRRIHPYAFTSASHAVPISNGATARIWIPEGVTELERGTFRNCFWLESLSLPSTIEKIDVGAWSCVTMYTGWKKDGSGGYARTTTNGLKNLIIRAKTPPEIVGVQKGVTRVNVPNASIRAYEGALAGKVGYKRLH